MTMLFQGAKISQNTAQGTFGYAAGDCNASLMVSAPIAGETFNATVRYWEMRTGGALRLLYSFVIAPSGGAVPSSTGPGTGATATGYLDGTGSYIYQTQDLFIHGGASIFADMVLNSGTVIGGVSAEVVF